jgi:hypothetical protein
MSVAEIITAVIAGLALAVSVLAYLSSRRGTVASERSADAAEASAQAAQRTADTAEREEAARVQERYEAAGPVFEVVSSHYTSEELVAELEMVSGPELADLEIRPPDPTRPEAKAVAGVAGQPGDGTRGYSVWRNGMAPGSRFTFVLVLDADALRGLGMSFMVPITVNEPADGRQWTKHVQILPSRSRLGG